MKKLMTLLVVILVVIFVLSFTKDMIAKAAVEKGVEIVTGLKLNMRSFSIGLLKSFVSIKDLNLYNPGGFKDKIMIDMPEIYVSYDLRALMKKIVHVKEMRIDLKEFVIVKNEKGQLNLDSLKSIQAQKEGKKPQEQDKGRMPQIQLDKLQLKIGKVVYKDYSRGTEPSVKEIAINMDQTYHNITDPYSLVSLIVVNVVTRAALSNIVNIDIQGLQGTISDTLSSAGKMASSVTQQTLQGTAKAAEGAAQGATEAVQKTADVLKNAIKLPFGGEK